MMAISRSKYKLLLRNIVFTVLGLITLVIVFIAGLLFLGFAYIMIFIRKL